MQPAAPPAPPPRIARRPQFSPLTGLAMLATVLCIAAFIWLRHPGDGTSYQFYGQWVGKEAPDFTLTNQDGGLTRLSGLRGNVVLLTFGFTHCPNICPTTLANLAAIRQMLTPRKQARMQVLFVTVDPARDTPEVLKGYVPFYSKGFTGLTGSAEDIAKIAKDYGAWYEAVMQDSQVAGDYYTVNHSAYVYLIDPAGRFALLYNNDKLTDHGRMAQDIEHEIDSGGQ